MASFKKQNESKHPVLSAGFRVVVERLVEKFIEAPDEELKFPTTLSKEQRSFIEEYVFKFALLSKIAGKGSTTQVVVFKTKEALLSAENSVIELRSSSKKLILKMLGFLNELPDIAANTYGEVETNLDPDMVAIGSVSKHRSNVVTVPPSNYNPACAHFRQDLPIFRYRQKILSLIDSNQVLIVESATGSGKSTQIPQFILEECSRNKRQCRIIVAEPKRICATTLAERVSFERGEDIGSTVGYQIRLQSKVSPTSNLIYVTNGVILRMLMSGHPEEFFQGITTLVIDEVHERDKFSDFLLLCTREYLHLNPHLRVVIMSATIDSRIFQEYFGGCPVIKLEGQAHEVEEFFLEDLLKLLKFSNGRVEDLRQKHEKNPQALEKPVRSYGDGRNIDVYMKEAANEILDKIARTPDCNNEFCSFFYAVQADNIPVNFRHAGTNKTALMFAVEYGFVSHVEKLLNLKADPMMTMMLEGREINCLELTMMRNNPQIIKTLVNYLELMNGPKVGTEMLETSTYDRMLLDIYYDTLVQPGVNRGNFLEDIIDLQLIVRLIRNLHFNTDRSFGILVFLPGHDEIVHLANLISNALDINFNIFILHSQMQTHDQISVFDKMPPGVRKIILATNLAESSITVDDVVYVIDTGKEKQKDFNAVTNVSSLRTQWISKASAKQRKGRAGRKLKGFCYRLYSKDRYNYLVENPKPEFVRCEMTDICLQVKMIAKPGVAIADFLRKGLTPPSELSIKHSIKILRELGAIQEDETLTQLGYYLADIPLNAKYGKMLIFGIFFKCLDPILTLVSILSVNEPFTLLRSNEDRDLCHKLKMRLEEGSYSDHFVMLRIYQKWNEYQTRNEFDGGFCEDNFVNSGTMQRIASTRVKIVGYLRSVRLIQNTGNLSALNQYSNNWSIVKACLCAGSYPGVARIDKIKGNISSAVDQKLFITANSVLRLNNNERLKKENIAKFPANWMIFEEKNHAGSYPMAKICTLISNVCLVLTGGIRLCVNEDSCSEDGHEGDESLVELEIDNFIKFIATPVVALSLQEVRDKFNAVLNKFLLNVEKFRFKENDEILIEGVVKLLEIEDEKVGFKINHQGIGSRPRVITREYNTSGREVRVARGSTNIEKSQGLQMVPPNAQQSKKSERSKRVEKEPMKVVQVESNTENQIVHEKLEKKLNEDKVIERKDELKKHENSDEDFKIENVEIISPTVQEIVKSEDEQLIETQEPSKEIKDDESSVLNNEVEKESEKQVEFIECFNDKSDDQLHLPDSVEIDEKSEGCELHEVVQDEIISDDELEDLEKTLQNVLIESEDSENEPEGANKESEDSDSENASEVDESASEDGSFSKNTESASEVAESASDAGESDPEINESASEDYENVSEDEENESESSDSEVEDSPQFVVDEKSKDDINMQSQMKENGEASKPICGNLNHGRPRYFMVKLESEKLSKKLHQQTCVTLHTDAKLPDGLIDTLIEAEVNDPISKKALVFYNDKKIVGAGLLLNRGEFMSRETLKMFFQCDQTVDSSVLKSIVDEEKLKEMFSGLYSEIPINVGKMCVDKCIEKPKKTDG